MASYAPHVKQSPGTNDGPPDTESQDGEFYYSRDLYIALGNLSYERLVRFVIYLDPKNFTKKPPQYTAYNWLLMRGKRDKIYKLAQKRIKEWEGANELFGQVPDRLIVRKSLKHALYALEKGLFEVIRFCDTEEGSVGKTPVPYKETEEEMFRRVKLVEDQREEEDVFYARKRVSELKVGSEGQCKRSHATNTLDKYHPSRLASPIFIFCFIELLVSSSVASLPPVYFAHLFRSVISVFVGLFPSFRTSDVARLRVEVICSDTHDAENSLDHTHHASRLANARLYHLHHSVPLLIHQLQVPHSLHVYISAIFVEMSYSFSGNKIIESSVKIAPAGPTRGRDVDDLILTIEGILRSISQRLGVPIERIKAELRGERSRSDVASSPERLANNPDSVIGLFLSMIAAANQNQQASRAYDGASDERDKYAWMEWTDAFDALSPEEQEHYFFTTTNPHDPAKEDIEYVEKTLIPLITTRRSLKNAFKLAPYCNALRHIMIKTDKFDPMGG
ncbi:hypothetical protein BJ508DRAFT_340484 [Ascobolus immersus RN42]|uniref:Uncharacterized protein n=1 Tax=Ascobolus immersus RN42 TaxID=1160509 RepID=A0A3N4HLZ8_ASCIM|nr:hypothetical protein BJ508DRAFT_340484 [Ascobolus immersus RN42]